MKTLTKKVNLTKTLRLSFSTLPFRLLCVVLICLLMIVQSCKKHDFDHPQFGSLDLKVVADNFVSPITMVDAPDDSKRLFVVDQIGKVWIIKEDGSKMAQPFIDVSSKIVHLTPQYDERGLLGLAFHPNFKSNGKFYLFYTAPPRDGGPQPGALWNNLTR